MVASTEFIRPLMFLSFLLLASARRGFFPTHLREHFPLIFMVMEVMAAIWFSSACPPVKVRISPGSSAGSPMVSESNGT